MDFRRIRNSQFQTDTGSLYKRLVVIVGASLFLIGILVLRLWVLQVVRGEEYRQRSENNRIQTKSVRGLRGKILDRNGHLLAGNRAAFHLALIPRSVPDLSKRLNHLKKRTGLDPDRAMAKIRRGNPFKPITIQRNLSREAVAYLMEHRWQLPGILIQIKPQREYPQESMASQLMGYLGKVSEKRLKRKAGYQPEDLTGKQGIERDFEGILRGSRGKQWVEVDAFGREIKLIGKRLAKPGKNLVLTLDLELQQKAESLMANHLGVMIAMDPRTGEILALASNPNFDPNKLTNGMSTKSWSSLLKNPTKILLNRATRAYPPGSVFKIVMAAAALEEGIMKVNDTIFCQGEIFYGDRTYRCWEARGHRNSNLHRALVESCDVYFYKIGLELGINQIAKYASAFGLGKPTGIVQFGEKVGIVPTPAWKKKAKKKPWYPGETVSVSIGQGFTTVTPIQIAVLTAAIANGGTLFQPLLVRRIEESNGTVLETFASRITGRLPLTPKNMKIIRNALRGVVHDSRGTGYLAKLPGIKIAGKTGTAQVARLKNRKDSKEQLAGLRKLRDHAWFIAFAPFDDPEIAVVVFAEHAGKGGSRFAPLAKALMAHHLKINIAEPMAKVSGSQSSRHLLNSSHDLRINE